MSEDKAQEIQKAFSEVAAEFAQEKGKLAEENPEALKAENLPPEEQMEFNSKFFQMYSKHFNNLTAGLNKKSLIRVIQRLISYPLETPADMRWTSENEKNAFLIGDQLLEVKYLMYKYVLQQAIEKAKKDKELKEEVKGEENNGEAKTT